MNSQWLLEDYDSYIEFTASGCLSDYSCGIVYTLVRDRVPNGPSNSSICEHYMESFKIWLKLLGNPCARKCSV